MSAIAFSKPGSEQIEDRKQKGELDYFGLG
jgi:hypothetical protein